MSALMTAGSINTDLVVRVQRAPQAGETVTGLGFDIFGGGKGANQTIAAARSGVEISILGAIGDDDFGRQRLADLEQEGIDVSGVLLVPDAPSGVAVITVEESGENRISYVPGATQKITPEHVRETMRRTSPETILMTLELPEDALGAVLDEGERSGALAILNATPEPGQFLALIARANILIVNETEAREILGWDIAQSDWEAAAVRLAGLGPSNVVITLGASGALILDQDGIGLIEAPQVDVIDTTGAGDAFCGAFAARISQGEPVQSAAQAGVIAGSIAVMRMGAQPSQPTRDQIEAARAHWLFP